MSVLEDAARLEGLVPRAMSVLFRPTEDDPLRHHSVGQVRLMRALLGGKKTATDLSQTLGLSPSSLTQMASRMISAGLVSKELDPNDRRVRMLSLTPAGRLTMVNRQAMRARSAARVLDKLDPQKFHLLVELLEEIIALQSEVSFVLLEGVV